MTNILKDRSFRLSIILTFIFFGTGIAFLFLGLVSLPTASLTDFATSIKEGNGDIYVAGEEGTYWKNGKQIKLSSPNFLVRDIFVVPQKSY